MPLSSLIAAIDAAGFNSGSEKISKAGLNEVVNEIARGIYVGGGTRIVQIIGGNQVYQFTNDPELLQTDPEFIVGAYITVRISNLAINGNTDNVVLLDPSVFTCYCPAGTSVNYYEIPIASLANSKIDAVYKSACQIGCRLIVEDHVVFVSDSGTGTAVTFKVSVHQACMLLIKSNTGND